MTYTTEIIIDLPRAQCIEKLGNRDHLKHWQRGLIAQNLLSGIPGQEGAKTELHYKVGKKDMILIETIIKNNLPEELHATYDTQGVHNLQKNYFTEVNEHATLWVSETRFEFNGFFMKLMALLMPGAFKKQSRQYAEDFKAFAERGTSVAEP